MATNTANRQQCAPTAARNSNEDQIGDRQLIEAANDYFKRVKIVLDLLILSGSDPAYREDTVSNVAEFLDELADDMNGTIDRWWDATAVPRLPEVRARTTAEPSTEVDAGESTGDAEDDDRTGAQHKRGQRICAILRNATEEVRRECDPQGIEAQLETRDGITLKKLTDRLNYLTGVADMAAAIVIGETEIGVGALGAALNGLHSELLEAFTWASHLEHEEHSTHE